MKTARTTWCVVALLAGACLELWNPASAEACSDPAPIYAQQAVYSDDAARVTAIEKLRTMGPKGLQSLAKIHADLLPLVSQPAAVGKTTWPGKADPNNVARLREALDQVAQQRGAAGSLLYWYTDLETAKQEAHRSGRPILSLRLLGKLTDEQSCANSRFFRTVLYTNREVADKLRESFVLHWSSERPVPVITVDFGDGRVLKRTMMGNSAHYVLDASGRPVDVVPGLYGPKAFLKAVGQAAIVAQEVSPLSDTVAAGKLVEFHRARLKASKAAWTADLVKAGGPNLNQVGGSLRAATTEELWTKIAMLHADDAKLDDASKLLVRSERPNGPPASAAMRLAVGKRMVETPMLQAAQAALQFEQNVAIDTMRNEYLLHSTVHAWFARGDTTLDFARLNRRVYAELFLTPASDPWMGLAPPVYTGLEGAGLGVSAR